MAAETYRSDDGARFTAEPLALDPPPFEAFAAFLDYWGRLKGERIAPAAAEFDPVAMRGYLATVTLVRYRAEDGTFWFGLSGTGVYGLHNRELSHSSLWDLRPPAYAELLHAHFRRTVDTGRANAWRIGLHVDGTDAYYHTLRAPLSDDGERYTGLATIDLLDRKWRAMSGYFDRAYGRD